MVIFPGKEKDDRAIHPESYCLDASSACHLLSRWFLLGLLFDPEDGGDIILRNVL
jgi:hypothetical protein